MSAINANEIQKIPEYVIQPNAISQSMYSASTNARRLMAMAMALLPTDTEDYKVQFLLQDFVKALGMVDGEKTRSLIKAAAEECTGNLIKILQPNGDYLIYTWFNKTLLTTFDGYRRSMNPKAPPVAMPHWDTITMWFNPELGEAIKAFKKAFAKLDLIDLGKLQSRYAIRFYELALSYAGFEGKDGNRRGEWWFQHTLDELRALFQVDEKQYKLANAFRRKIIDLPIKEINDANIGLRIEPKYIRRGKWLIGARFNCRWLKPDEPLPVTPVTETESENEQLRAAFPEEFEKYKAEYMEQVRKQPNLWPSDTVESVAESHADEELRKAHPNYLKTNKTTRKKSEKNRKN